MTDQILKDTNTKQRRQIECDCPVINELKLGSRACKQTINL